MKKLLPLLLALLLLTGCRELYPDEYISVKEHEAPFAQRETAMETLEPETAGTDPQPYTVYNQNEILEEIKTLMDRGETTGRFRADKFKGNIETSMQRSFSKLLAESPKYCYALDSFDWSVSGAGADRMLQVTLHSRLTPQELAEIQDVTYSEFTDAVLCDALCQLSLTCTVQVSDYRDTDFRGLLEEFALHNPDKVVVLPRLSVMVYPDSGKIRVVELRFIYQTDRQTLNQRLRESNVVLSAVCNQLSPRMEAGELVDTIYRNLMEQLIPDQAYEANEAATVYTLLTEKKGSSRSMASVAEYLCQYAGCPCEIVEGLRSGEPWYWNRIQSDGVWHYFDLHAAALGGELPVLLRPEEMPEYSFDPERYPELEETAPPEASETTEETDAAGTPADAP